MQFQALAALCETSVFDNLFIYSENTGPDSDAVLHHNEQCNYGNWLNLGNERQVVQWCEKHDDPDYLPAGFVVFDQTVSGPTSMGNGNCLDFEPKGMIYLRSNYDSSLDPDVMKKLTKFVRSKQCSLYVEPVFV